MTAALPARDRTAPRANPLLPDSRPPDVQTLPAPIAPTRFPILGAAAVVVIGVALGLAATAGVVSRSWDPGAVAVGPWVAQPRIGTSAIDPYARAELARSGAIPMAANEGMSFTAETDGTGYRLLRTCSYRIAGAVPPARAWTLTATGRDGRTMETPAERFAFASWTVVRDLSGAFAVVASPVAQPGNWLPLSGDGPLTLTLRLYDTPLTADVGRIGSATLPSIDRLSCAASAEAGR